MLLYDYGRGQWMDNIGTGLGVNAIAYFPDQNQLLMRLPDGSALTYNPAFRRVAPATTAFRESPGGTTPSDLNGLSLGGDFTFLGDGVRDRYNRRDSVNLARVFDYDHLWVLTAGDGAFLGSYRRKEAESVWFGLYDSSVISIYGAGQNMWFGAPDPAGALVRAKSDLSEWKIYAAQQDYEFPDGTLYDMVEWKNYLWLATAKGVVRQDENTGQFRLFNRMQGSTDINVYRLFVFQDRLYAGTEKGVAVLEAPEAQFQAAPLPVDIAPPVSDFCISRGKDLWAATRYGLFVLRKDGWKSIKDVTLEDVPDAYGVDVTTVGYADSTLYWADADHIYAKRPKQQTKSVIDLANVFRIVMEDGVMYAGFDDGVRAYNLKSHLWVDFRLEDGIPGHKVQSLFVQNGLLWIGTDLGVMRVTLRPYLP